MSKIENSFAFLCGGAGVRIPEDAVPIVDDKMLLVADGLGGSGCSAHTTLKPEVMSADTCFETLFGNVLTLSDENREKVNRYLCASLDNYFSISPEQKTSRDCKFKGGYFASRLVSSIVYATFLEKDKEWLHSILQQMSELKGEDLINQQNEIGKYYACVIQKALEQAAKNGNFKMESSIKSSLKLLLPTTLVTILYEEHEDYVDALYLWAGDSRGQIWTKKNGLQQVTVDQEQNEVMNSVISLSGPFSLAVKYIRIPKPCLLFAISDGCYKSFTSSLDVEYFFFSQFIKADSYEKASELEQKIFKTSSVDDAFSTALRAFGYDSYNTLKADITERIESIESYYEKELPGIFTVDYSVQLTQSRKAIRAAVKDIDVSKYPDLKKAIKRELKNSDPDAWKKPILERKNRARNQLRHIIEDNYILILYWMSQSADSKTFLSKLDQKTVEKCRHMIEDMFDKEKSFLDDISARKNDLSKNAEMISSTLDRMADFDFATIRDDETYEARNYFDAVVSLIDDVMDDRNRDLKIYEDHMRKIKSKSKDYAENNTDSVYSILDKLAYKVIPVELFSRLKECPKIEAKLEEIATCEDELHDEKKRNAIETKEINNYWNAHCVDVICDLAKSSPNSPAIVALDEDIQAEIKNCHILAEKLKKRDMLYRQYEEHYYIE